MKSKTIDEIAEVFNFNKIINGENYTNDTVYEKIVGKCLYFIYESKTSDKSIYKFAIIKEISLPLSITCETLEELSLNIKSYLLEVIRNEKVDNILNSK